MAKIIKICLIFLLMTGWIYSGWPRVFNFPPKIQEAYALTATKTFTFETTAESWVANDGVKSTLSYDSGAGNPAGALKAQTTTKNASSIGYWEWIGAWEDLGVPNGATVTQIRVNAGYTRCTAYDYGDPSTAGPYEIWDNEAVPAQMVVLWAGRDITGTDTVWEAIVQQADQDVIAGYQASTSTIRLRLYNTLDTQNTKQAINVTIYDDEVSFVITYTLPAVSISITNDIVAFQTVVLNTTVDNSGDLPVITVDSGPANLKVKSTVFTEGGNTWTLHETGNGPNQVLWEFSKNGTEWAPFIVAGTEYPFDTNVPTSGTRNLYLRLTTPTETASYNQYSSTVTVVASVP